jgi:hypothetical protein
MGTSDVGPENLLTHAVGCLTARRVAILAIVFLSVVMLCVSSSFQVIGTSAGAAAPQASKLSGGTHAPSAFMGYNVTFSQTGLTMGTTWAVTLNGIVKSARGNIVFPEIPNGTTPWNTTSYAGLYPTPGSGSIQVSGAAATQPIVFAALPGRYTVTFSETGLPGGTAWGVTFNNTYYLAAGGGPGGARVTIPNVVNKTLGYAWNVSTFGGLFPNPSSGSIVVNGSSPPTQAIAFAAAPGHYTVTFSETGLTGATVWGVTFNKTYYVAAGGGPGGSRVTIPNVVNNTLGYAWNASTFGGLFPHPASGSIVVNGSNPATQVIAFLPAPGRYTVTFTQTGLPGGTAWGVTFNGTYYPAAAGFGGAVTVTNVVNHTYAWNVSTFAGLFPSPASGSIVVNGTNPAPTAIVFAAAPGHYTVTFRETGLPGGTTWYLTFNNTLYSSATRTITIANVVNNTIGYAWNVTAIAGYSAAPPNGVLPVNGTNPPRQNIVFTPLTPGSYTVTFEETGLTTGTGWSVTLNGTLQAGVASNSIVFIVQNGTLSFNVTPVAGYQDTPATGSVPVNGQNMVEQITFFKGQPRYTVTFTESGLAAGTNWSVVFNGTAVGYSTTPNIVFQSFMNGTYPFDVASIGRETPSLAAGEVTVTGANAVQDVTFTLEPVAYSVVFNPLGLPVTETWAVTLGTTEKSSTGGQIIFSEANGSYTYTVGSVSGYTASPSSGPVTVNGSAVQQNITFTAAIPVYGVTFQASGLPANATWTVVLGGTTHSDTSAAISFEEPNGTYSFTITAPSGYTASPSSGSVIVSGATVTKNVTISSSSSSSSPLSSGTIYLILVIVIVVVVVVVLLLVLLLHRRKGSKAGAPPPPPMTQSEQAGWPPAHEEEAPASPASPEPSPAPADAPPAPPPAGEVPPAPPSE